MRPGLVAVGEILFHEHEGGRDRDRTELMQCQRGDPELPVPLQHEHNGIPLADAERHEIVCRAVGEQRQLAEGEQSLVLFAVEV